MYYVGVDLHKHYLTVCVLDRGGEGVAEHRRLRNTREAILEVLAEWEKPVSVALEACLHWAWLHDVLVREGYEVQVAHLYEVKLICHARCKTDPVDARKLADLLRTNLLPTLPGQLHRIGSGHQAASVARRQLTPLRSPPSSGRWHRIPAIFAGERVGEGDRQCGSGS